MTAFVKSIINEINSNSLNILDEFVDMNDETLVSIKKKDSLLNISNPIMLDIVSNLNIDHNSKNYGEYYDTKLGLLWHKRAYEFGIYYHPDNDAGGLYFRINGFSFDNSVKAAF